MIIEVQGYLIETQQIFTITPIQSTPEYNLDVLSLLYARFSIVPLNKKEPIEIILRGQAFFETYTREGALVPPHILDNKARMKALKDEVQRIRDWVYAQWKGEQSLLPSIRFNSAWNNPIEFTD